jgi:hypothetical protein
MGYLAGVTGISNVTLPGNIPPNEWDSWHTLILTDEISRVVCPPGFFGEERAEIFRVILVFCGDLVVEMVLVFRRL